MLRPRRSAGRFRCFDYSPKVSYPEVMMHLRFPQLLRNIEDLRVRLAP